MSQSPPTPEIARLGDPFIPLEIEYSRPAMEKIRQHAVDGLMALPRIGMGVGGVLLGTRGNGLVRVLNSIEIPCSHSAGPSFNLTGGEKAHVRELIASVGQAGVVGWYCSRTRGAPVLSEAETALYRELFPGAPQIALVIRPSTIEPTRVAFFFRDERGSVAKGPECELEEWQPEEPESGAGEQPVGEEAFPPIPIETAPEPAPPVAALTQTVDIGPAASVPEIVLNAVPEPPPVPRRPAPPATPQPKRVRKNRFGWVLIAASAVVFGAAGFFWQDLWQPRPPLTLSSTQSGGNLIMRWNVDALRGVDHASLNVNDGGTLQSVPLARFQLDQGTYVYSPKSDRVTAKLSAGDMSAIAVWLAPQPEPSAVPAPPVLSDETRSPPAAPDATKTAPAAKP